MRKTYRSFLFLVTVGLILAACSRSFLDPPPTPTIDLFAALTALAPTFNPAPTQETQPDATQPPVLSEDPTPTPEIYRFWVAPYLPGSITQGLVAPVALQTVNERDQAQIWLEASPDGIPVSSLVYALVAPFPAMQDGASYANLEQTWRGLPAGAFGSGNLYLTQRTLTIFSKIWGEPQGSFVRTVSEEELLNSVWFNSPAWALVPFETLRPEWKVLAVDDINPLWKDFDLSSYPLAIPISLNGTDAGVLPSIADAFIAALPDAVNRDNTKLTTVVMTGVTALVRATAFEMDNKGVLHPAGELGPMLREADILHISNEVPFAENCPPPNPVNRGLVFCSDDRYMELLENIGTDVVELTGDHFSDWGVEATLHTFDLYDAEGWQYYGGGRTPEQGRLPIVMEHNGNKIAFIGCNGKGGSYTPSVRGLPGAVDCDFNLIASEIARLKEEGYLVIMTYQHHETYSYTPTPELVADFLFTADAGADIVSGSQAHQPHGMTFHAGSTVMYGLGNLFFDQLLISPDTAKALVARHVIYDNRHISTEIITIYFADFSEPLYLEGDGRLELLGKVFAASDWGELSYP
jgi:hypothetical protein